MPTQAFTRSTGGTDVRAARFSLSSQGGIGREGEREGEREGSLEGKRVSASPDGQMAFSDIVHDVASEVRSPPLTPGHLRNAKEARGTFTRELPLVVWSRRCAAPCGFDKDSALLARGGDSSRVFPFEPLRLAGDAVPLSRTAAQPPSPPSSARQ